MTQYSRSAGVILPVFSLPSPYGIGTLGKAAKDFARFLANAGQSYWQILPLGATGFGDSPYQSFSSFAGNPYFIDLDLLASDGLLSQAEIASVNWGENAERVDYGLIYENRFSLLKLAYERGYAEIESEIEQFEQENAHWLADYALFMALKRHFDMRPWYEWDSDISSRQADALRHYSELLIDDIKLFKFIQFKFYKQFDSLRSYCESLGLSLIGDMPIYAALDSADVWSHTEIFYLDSENRPIEVAGVPPDYFSETGQLWGNPLYRWDVMAQDNFSWWKARIRALSRQFHIIRIDHFRGLESFWSVPFGHETAEHGKWNAGPKEAFIDMLSAEFPNVRFFAEDLGIITYEVRALRKYARIPGMAVLAFAFNPDSESSYLPRYLYYDTILYTGTHDNDTLRGWLDSAPEKEREYIREYCDGDTALSVIRCGLASRADVFIAQMQDWLNLGSSARINTPGALGSNWQWRLAQDALSPELCELIFKQTKTFDRLNKYGKKETII